MPKHLAFNLIPKILLTLIIWGPFIYLDKVPTYALLGIGIVLISFYSVVGMFENYLYKSRVNENTGFIDYLILIRDADNKFTALYVFSYFAAIPIISSIVQGLWTRFH